MLLGLAANTVNVPGAGYLWFICVSIWVNEPRYRSGRGRGVAPSASDVRGRRCCTERSDAGHYRRLCFFNDLVGILVDLERSQVVDLLSTRSADSLGEWLAQHPEVTTVSRDRQGV
jgi:hypothetical protein